MRKLCCTLLVLLLTLCCASVLAEECKYYREDSPCDVIWWVNAETKMHALACDEHWENFAPALISEWEPCAIDDDGVCAVCNYDYKSDINTLPEGAMGQCAPYLNGYYCSCGFSTTDRSAIKAYFNLTKHWWVCPECGKDNSDSHYGYCDTPDNCRICNIGGVETITSHNPKLGTVVAHDQYTHWEACAGCGEPTLFAEFRPHYEVCDAPGVCSECGAADVTFKNFVHAFGGTEYEHDANYHWYTCDGCGEQAKVLHSMNCNDPDAAPDVCYMCDAEGVTIGEFYHNFDGSAYCKVSDTHHVLCCAGCGAADPSYAPEKHVGDCRTPDVCYFCFETGVVIVEYFHEGDQRYEYADETQHALTCSNCDYQVKSNHQAHTISCANPGVCWICGAENLPIDPDNHGNVDRSTYVWDDDSCWNVCLECGGNANVGAHFMDRCAKEKRCQRCGQSDVNIEVGMHSFDEYGSYGVYLFNEDEHWIICSRCGDEKHEAHIFYNEDTICGRCGYEKPAYIPGDASSDGMVDIFDALAILQYSVGWGTEINLEASDVNDDGMMDIFDALLILQYSVGWDVELK